MGPHSIYSPLIVMLGVTCSGKSELGIELAQRFSGEIISADSRTIYRGMDILTAKPTPKERALVRHHLIDVASPDQPFSVASFKQRATDAIAEISSRKRLPFLIGGSGLYIDALIYNYAFPPSPNKELHLELKNKSLHDLRRYIQDNGIEMPRDHNNPRRLIRSIETNGILGHKGGLRQNTLILGLAVSRELLKQKLIARVDNMVEAGLISEITELSHLYGRDAPSLQTPGFKAFQKFLDKECDLAEAKQEFVRKDMNLAKRQTTWFKRNKDVHWIKSKEEAVDLVTTFLNK